MSVRWSMMIESKSGPSVRPSIGRSVGQSCFTCYYDFISLTSLPLPKWSGDLIYGPCPPACDWGGRVSGHVCCSRDSLAVILVSAYPTFKGGSNIKLNDVIRKCELGHLISNNVVDITSDEFLLHIPVTSSVGSVTYANVFCAICNHEKNFWFWNVKVIMNMFKRCL